MGGKTLLRGPWIAAIVLALGATLPGAAFAGPLDKRDRAEAAKECLALSIAAGTAENLGLVFRTDAADAMSRCRQVQARGSHRERHRSRSRAMQKCTSDRAGFPTRGLCVAATARALNAAADRRDRARVAPIAACRADDETSEGYAFERCIAGLPPGPPPEDVSGSGPRSMDWGP